MAEAKNFIFFLVVLYSSEIFDADFVAKNTAYCDEEIWLWEME